MTTKLGCSSMIVSPANNGIPINQDSVAMLGVSLLVQGLFSFAIYRSFSLIQNIFVPKLIEKRKDEEVSVIQAAGSSLNQSDVKNALEKDKSLEEKCLLHYVSQNELKKIQSLYNPLLQNEVVGCIKLGRWKELIAFYTEDPSSSIHKAIKTAHLEGKITIDELATAYIFLAPAVSNQSYTIHKFEELLLDPNWGALKARWESIDHIPENLRFCISVEKMSMSSSSRNLIEQFFDKRNGVNQVAGGISHSNNTKYGMVSAALLKADSFVKDSSIIFIRGLSERSDMYRHLKKGFLGYALFDPGEENILIDGAKGEGLLPYFHQGFHIHERMQTKILDEKDLLDFGQFLEYQLKNSIPGYSRPHILIKDSAYPHIDANASSSDIARYTLEYASALILHGEVGENLSNKDCVGRIEDLFSTAIRSITQKYPNSIDFLRLSSPLHLKNLLQGSPLSIVNQHLASKGLHIEAKGYTWKVSRK